MYDIELFTYAHFHKCYSGCMNGKVIGRRTFKAKDDEEIKQYVSGKLFDLPKSAGTIKRNVMTFNAKDSDNTIKIVAVIKQNIILSEMPNTNIVSRIDKIAS